MRKRRLRITDLFPEAADRYEEPSARGAGIFVGICAVLVVIALLVIVL